MSNIRTIDASIGFARIEAARCVTEKLGTQRTQSGNRPATLRTGVRESCKGLRMCPADEARHCEIESNC